jgi:predicted nuclease of restriction endonuclease-like (RecB) superfamily
MNILAILSRSKTIVKKEIYLKLCVQEKYTSCELARQINALVYERLFSAFQKSQHR